MKSLTARLLAVLREPHTINLPEKTASFLVRIQLASNADYDDLHDAMLEDGFEREIRAVDGSSKQLPDATYFLARQSDDTSAEAVHSRVERAVTKHKIRTNQPRVTAQTLVVEVSDAWFELNDSAD